MNALFKRLCDAFRDKEYRQIYAEGFSDSKIATQIKVLREQRGWTQQQLAEAAGMKQSRIAALEDVNYASWSVRTLRRLAQAFDLWLDVELKEFGVVWPQLRDFSRESLARRSFVDDPVFNEGKAEQKPATKAAFVHRATSPVTVSQAKLPGSALSFGLGQTSSGQGFGMRWQSSVAAPLRISVIDVTEILEKPFIKPSSATQMVLRDGGNSETRLPNKSSGALAAVA